MKSYDEIIDERLAEVPDGPNPLDVDCPYCHAETGHRCRSTKSGYAARTHTSRWNAVGVTSPSADDLSRDYWEGEKRQLQRKLASTPNLKAVLGR